MWPRSTDDHTSPMSPSTLLPVDTARALFSPLSLSSVKVNAGLRTHWRVGSASRESHWPLRGWACPLHMQGTCGFSQGMCPLTTWGTPKEGCATASGEQEQGSREYSVQGCACPYTERGTCPVYRVGWGHGSGSTSSQGSVTALPLTLHYIHSTVPGIHQDPLPSLCHP